MRNSSCPGEKSTNLILIALEGDINTDMDGNCYLLLEQLAGTSFMLNKFISHTAPCLDNL